MSAELAISTHTQIWKTKASEEYNWKKGKINLLHSQIKSWIRNPNTVLHYR